MAITLGAFTAEALYRSIAVELKYTSDDLEQATFLLEFKKHSDSSWRQALQMWRYGGTPADGNGRAVYGKALLLDEGTSYDVRVTVGGTTVTGTNPATATVSTKALPADPSTLSPTRYVDQNGSDSNDGLTSGTAWATLSKAVSTAPSGAVVRLASGIYLPGGSRTSPLTIVAQNPALDASRNRINASSRAIIEPTRGTRPTGSASTGDNAGLTVGPWVQVTPDGNAAHILWKWTASGILDPTTCGFSSTRRGLPRRLPNFKDGGDTTTPAAFATNVYNTSVAAGTYGQPHGFFQDTGTTDLYVRLPADANPNSYYLTFGKRGQTALTFGAADIRISGVELRCFDRGLYFYQGSVRPIIDRSILDVCHTGLYMDGSAPGTYGSDLLAYQCAGLDEGNYQEDRDGVGWNFIKGGNRNGQESESQFAYMRGGIRRFSLLDSTIDKYFNGITTYHTGGGFDRYAGYGLEGDNSIIKHASDDPIELEDTCCNASFTRLTVRRTFTFISAAPLKIGPLYVARCDVTMDNKGIRDAASGTAFEQYGIKYDRASNPKAAIILAHNTIWSNSSIGGASDGSYQGGSGSGATHPFIWERNTIIRTSKWAARWLDGPAQYDEDYNLHATSGVDTSKVFFVGLVNYRTLADLATYRANTPNGDHSQKIGGVDVAFDDEAAVDALFASIADTETADLSLKSSAGVINGGVIVPNISDVPYPGSGLLLPYHYVGSAPDLGAHEFQPGGTGVTAAFALSAGGPSLSFSATVTNPTPPVTAAFGVAAGGPSLSFAGKERIKGPFAVAAGGPTTAFAATVTNPIPPVSATFALAAGGPTIALDGAEAFPAAFSITAGGPTLALDGVVTNPPPPSVSADFSLSAGGPGLALDGAEAFPATLDLSAGGPALVFSGTVTPAPIVVIGAFSEHGGGPTLAFAGKEVVIGTLSESAGGPAISLLGTVIQPGPPNISAVVSVVAGGPVLNFTGNQVFSGDFAIAAGGPTILFLRRHGGKKLKQPPRSFVVQR